MKYKQIIALLLCASLTFPSVPAFAAEELGAISAETGITEGAPGLESDNTTENKNQTSTGSLLNADFDGIFSDMSNSLLNGQYLTLSDAIQNNSDLKLSTDSKFDMSDMNLISSTAVDMGLVNMQYQNLSANLSNSFNGMDLSGKSQNCMSLFDNTYGGIAEQLSLSEPQLPEGFTVSNMIDSASSAVNSMYSSASNSESFSSVKGSVSVGKIFSAANAGLSMPSLASDAELKSTIAGLDSANYSKAYSSYLTSKMDVKSHTKNASQLSDQTNQNFLNIVDMSDACMNLDGSINRDNLKSSIDNVDKMFTDVTNAKYDNIITKGKYHIGNFFNGIADKLGIKEHDIDAYTGATQRLDELAKESQQTKSKNSKGKKTSGTGNSFKKTIENVFGN